MTNDTLELNAFLEVLHTLSGDDLAKALERLSELGVEPQKASRRPGVMCPVTKMSIVAPCQVGSCPLRIENEWNRNCLLDYLESQSSEALTEEEISFIYQDSSANVKRVLDDGMKFLRGNLSNTMGVNCAPTRQEDAVVANVGEDEEIVISRLTLSPPFLGKTNAVLESLAREDLVFKHPAIRLLGILDSIFYEL